MNKLGTFFGLSCCLSTLLLAETVDSSDLETLKAQLESNAKSGFQLAGYAAFDYVNSENAQDEFSRVQFSPIFHYQYSDIIQFEGELEVSTTAEGETEVELEYAAATLFLNDYMGLQVGKFMSPLGQFVQNQHPSWINKLPTTPVGFGHDGAAPTSNIGVALRGGLPKVASVRSNYVVFVSNAPTFGLADDGDVIIGATGKTSSGDVAKTFGGRFALNPVGGMEIGFSGALGEASEELVNIDPSQRIARDYTTYGLDFMYKLFDVDLKAEYINQTIGENERSTLEGGTWEAWYTQAAYLIDVIHVEPVIRYSDYHNPETKRNQIAYGLNYLFSNNIIAKVAYEDNTNEINEQESNDKFLMQLAFGF